MNEIKEKTLKIRVPLHPIVCGACGSRGWFLSMTNDNKLLAICSNCGNIDDNIFDLEGNVKEETKYIG